MAKTYNWTNSVSGAWAYAGDWTETDTSPPTIPSTTSPVAGDTASISGPSTAVDVLSGPGSAATFNVGHNVALIGGAFAFTNLVVGSSSAGGYLSIIGGGTVTASTLSITNGQIMVDGSGSSLVLSSAVTLGGSYGEGIYVGAGATVTTANISGTPTLVVDPAGTFEIGSAGGAAMGALTIDAGFTLAIVKSAVEISAGITGALIDNGAVTLGAGTFTTIDGAISGSGTITIGASAYLSLAGTATGVGIAFSGTGENLNFNTVPTATISGFTFGDVLRDDTTPVGGVSYAQTSAGMGTLTLTGTDGTALGTLNLAGDYTGDTFVATPSGIEVLSGTAGAGAAPPSPGTAGTNYQWAVTGGGDWGAATNWGTSVAPGANDTVVIAGGSSPFVVRGQGQSASLEIGQAVGLGGYFSTGALSLGQSATLVLTSGTVLTAGSASLVTADAITAQGSGTLFQDTGVLSLFAAYSAGSTIQALGGATVQLASISAAAGSATTLVVDPSSHLEIGTAGGSQAGVVTIDAGQAVQFNGYIRTGVALEGSLELSGSGLVTGPITGPGTLILDGGSSYQATTVGSAIQFNGSALLFVTQVPTGVITGFGLGDGLTVTGLTFDQTQYSSSLGTLTLLEDGNTVGTLQLAGSYAGDTFLATPTLGYGSYQGGSEVPPQTLLTVATGTSGAGATPPSAGTTGETYVWTATSGDYGVAANYTANGNPATVAPGALDTVAISVPGNLAGYLAGPDDGEVVRGQGASAALTLTGNVVLGGSFTTGVLSVQPPSSYAGEVVLAAGTSLTAASAVISGTLEVAGAQLTVTGAVSGGGSVSATDGASVQLDTTSGSTNLGTLTVDNTSSIEIGGQGGATAGSVTVDAGQVLTAQTISAPLVLNGTLNAMTSVGVQGAVSGTGTITVGAGATLNVGAAIGSGVTITLGAGAALTLSSIGGNAPAISATIAGLTDGNAIYTGTPIDEAVYTATAPGLGTLTLSNAGTAFDTLTLVGTYSTAMFIPGAGQVELAEPACFCAGTLIRTSGGEVPVEALRIGDQVVTASGAAVAVRWVGRRSYAGRFLAGRANLRPILIRAGALGAGLPRRDLRVSPCHAMALDGLLVPARHLVNGMTIVQDRQAARVDYFHVELDHHDVIFAEGAPSETFLDDDSRGVFHNAHEFAALYPDAPLPGRFCAPRVEDGFELEAIRMRLAAVIETIATAA